MGSLPVLVCVIGLLILLNGLFACLEIALGSSPSRQAEKIRERGAAGRVNGDFSSAEYRRFLCRSADRNHLYCDAFIGPRRSVFPGTLCPVDRGHRGIADKSVGTSRGPSA